MSLLPGSIIEIVRLETDADSASYEVDGVGKDVWNCFLIVVLHFCDLPEGKDISCVMDGIALTRAVVRCLENWKTFVTCGKGIN